MPSSGGGVFVGNKLWSQVMFLAKLSRRGRRRWRMKGQGLHEAATGDRVALDLRLNLKRVQVITRIPGVVERCLGLPLLLSKHRPSTVEDRVNSVVNNRLLFYWNRMRLISVLLWSKNTQQWMECVSDPFLLQR